MSITVETTTDTQSSQTEIPEKQIDDLLHRVAATRLLAKELVSDWSQGLQLVSTVRRGVDTLGLSVDDEHVLNEAGEIVTLARVDERRWWRR